ncbi:MAG: hypothetical protein H5U17_10765 [Defluviimonas sp.]|nr:hypothetical protein [Defluviimonas sp.]
MSDTIELDTEIARLEMKLQDYDRLLAEHLQKRGPLDPVRQTKLAAWHDDITARLQKARSVKVAAEVSSDPVGIVLDWLLPDPIAAGRAAEPDVTSEEGAAHQQPPEEGPILHEDTQLPSIDAVKYFGVGTAEPSGCKGINTGKIVQFPAGTNAEMSGKSVRNESGHYVQDSGGNFVQPGGTRIDQQNKGQSGLEPEACAVVSCHPHPAPYHPLICPSVSACREANRGRRERSECRDTHHYP